MVIGLTGSMGAGKSQAAVRLAQRGARVVDADAISRRLVTEDAQCRRDILKAFGNGVFGPDGAVDRRRLATAVFQGPPGGRERLEAITHPRILAEMQRQSRSIAQRWPKAMILWDVPLLFEAKMDCYVQDTLLITAPQEIRLLRVMRRDGCTRRETLARLRAQMPEAEKRKLAGHVIENGGSLEALYQQLDVWYEEMTREGA